MSWNFSGASSSYTAGGASWMYASTFPDANLGQNYDFDSYYGMPNDKYYQTQPGAVQRDDGTWDYSEVKLANQSWSCVVYDDLSGWDLSPMAVNMEPF